MFNIANVGSEWEQFLAIYHLHPADIKGPKYLPVVFDSCLFYYES